MSRLIAFIKANLQAVIGNSGGCRTRMVDDYIFKCEVKKPNPHYCQYSVGHGYGFTCNHEDRRSFVPHS